MFMQSSAVDDGIRTVIAQLEENATAFEASAAAAETQAQEAWEIAQQKLNERDKWIMEADRLRGEAVRAQVQLKQLRSSLDA